MLHVCSTGSWGGYLGGSESLVEPPTLKKKRNFKTFPGDKGQPYGEIGERWCNSHFSAQSLPKSHFHWTKMQFMHKMLQIFKFPPKLAKIPDNRNFQRFPDPRKFNSLFGRPRDLTCIQGYSQRLRRFNIHDMVFNMCYQIPRIRCNIKRSAYQSVWIIEFWISRLLF